MFIATSSRVLLPGNDELQPATLEIDLGKIVGVHQGHLHKDKFPQHSQYTDFGDRVLLPGLVEYVCFH